MGTLSGLVERLQPTCKLIVHLLKGHFTSMMFGRQTTLSWGFYLCNSVFLDISLFQSVHGLHDVIKALGSLSNESLGPTGDV